MEENGSAGGEIYFAGGCFWGTEALFRGIPGVTSAVSGYANGSDGAAATYRQVCTGETGFRETVRVQFDPEQVSLEELLLAFFYVIDPTVEKRQGGDVGDQYQTGVYYVSERASETVRRIAAVEARGTAAFAVEIGPLRCFYPAEEYHQAYLQKNPGGYCHIPRAEIGIFRKRLIAPEEYTRPAKTLVNELLGTRG